MSATEDIYYIDRVLAGDVDAFAFIVDKHKDMAFVVANKILNNDMDAEEAAQDAFIKAYQNLNKFKKESKFSTWLYRIVYNAAIDKTRKKKKNIYSIDDEEAHFDVVEERMNELEEMELKEQQAIIKGAIDKLPEDESLIITLFYMEDQSVEEIAEITSFTSSNVKVKLFRARKKLFSLLENFKKVS